jgi:hypothetical protein
LRIVAGIFLLMEIGAGVCWGDGLWLPLRGFYHPGRAMPVAWGFSGSSGPIKASLEGETSSVVASPQGNAGCFPWIIYHSIPNFSTVLRPAGPAGASGDFGQELSPLTDSDRLLVVFGPWESSAKGLFPDRNVITVDLTKGYDGRGNYQSLLGSPMCWETVDGIIFSARLLEMLPAENKRELLAEGVMLAVDSDVAPDTELPWRKMGKLWVVSSGIALPPAVDPEVYSPTLGWVTGKSSAAREQIVLLAIVFALVVGGISLWKSRWMPLAIVAFCVGFSIALARQYQAGSAISYAYGEVRLSQDSLSVDDVWMFLQSRRDVPFSIGVQGLVEPIFSRPGQWADADLKLICDSNGDPQRLEGKLKADEPLAILSRRVAGQMNEAALSQTISSPLRSLAAESIYPGRQIVGQLNSPDDGTSGATTRWPTVDLK